MRAGLLRPLTPGAQSGPDGGCRAKDNHDPEHSPSEHAEGTPRSAETPASSHLPPQTGLREEDPRKASHRLWGACYGLGGLYSVVCTGPGSAVPQKHPHPETLGRVDCEARSRRPHLVRGQSLWKCRESRPARANTGPEAQLLPVAGRGPHFQLQHPGPPHSPRASLRNISGSRIEPLRKDTCLGLPPPHSREKKVSGCGHTRRAGGRRGGGGARPMSVTL